MRRRTTFWIPPTSVEEQTIGLSGAEEEGDLIIVAHDGITSGADIIREILAPIERGFCRDILWNNQMQYFIRLVKKKTK